MLKILISCVNYNSYDCLRKYLDSIKESLKWVKNGAIEVNILIADTSSNKQTFVYEGCNDMNVLLYPLTNLGYFGGVSAIFSKARNINDYDYVVISNVDLRLSPEFISILSTLDYSEDVCWLAPDIYSLTSDIHINPKILERYSKWKIKVLQFMFKHPLVYWAYTNTLALSRAKHRTITHSNAGEIYAGHGSFIVLTKKFFQFYTSITYPVFLFGEEIFLAELIRNIKGKVLYEPRLKIIDNEHESTGKMHLWTYCKRNSEALTYLISKFYKEK